MSDRRKKWSVGRFAGEIGGGAISGAAAVGAKTICFPDPTGHIQLAGFLAGAVGGAAASAFGSVWGYVTDDSFDMEFRSALLFSSVIGIALAVPFVLLGSLIDHGAMLTDKFLITVICFATFTTSAFSYLLDDRRARAERQEAVPYPDYSPN